MAGTNVGDANIKSAIKEVKEITSDASHALSREVFHQDRSKQTLSSNDDRVTMAGSTVPQDFAPRAMSEADPKAQMEASVYLKDNQAALDQALVQVQAGKADYSKMSNAEFAAKFGPSAQSFQDVEKFAKQYGLNVKDVDLAAGRIDLGGSTAQMDKAFGTDLKQVQGSDHKNYRAQVGAISLPKSLAGEVQAVLGLDNRAVAHTNYQTFQDATASAADAPKPAGATSFLPQDVAKAYNFPMDKGGAGSGIGIIELGGGLDLKDNATYYKENGLSMPKVNIIGVDGGKNAPSKGNGADGEVDLDSQVIGTVAPKTTQNLIFAPNSDQGFVDAISRATFGKDGEVPNQAISISWGAPESNWTDDAAGAMHDAIEKAAVKGMNVFAASGDDGAKDRTDSFQADLPSSIPESIACGGTRLIVQPGGKLTETVWNNGDGNGSGGGGISQKFGVPDYQKGLELPKNANGDNTAAGRGVPDISGDADPVTGYKIRVDGREGVIGGTSAVAPLYSALTALLTTENGGKSIGWLNPNLYKFGESKKGGVFNDVTQGNNNGYESGQGWDAASGWGSVNGTNLLKALQGSESEARQQKLATTVIPGTATLLDAAKV